MSSSYVAQEAWCTCCLEVNRTASAEERALAALHLKRVVVGQDLPVVAELLADHEMCCVGADLLDALVVGGTVTAMKAEPFLQLTEDHEDPRPGVRRVAAPVLEDGACSA